MIKLAKIGKVFCYWKPFTCQCVVFLPGPMIGLQFDIFYN